MEKKSLNNCKDLYKINTNFNKKFRNDGGSYSELKPDTDCNCDMYKYKKPHNGSLCRKNSNTSKATTLFNLNDEELNRKLFYYAYRCKQKMSGCIYGAVCGTFTSYCFGLKWGGGGGFVIGMVSQLIGTLIVCPVYGFCCGGLLGLHLDKQSVAQLLKEYRHSFCSGGLPPTHGSLN